MTPTTSGQIHVAGLKQGDRTRLINATGDHFWCLEEKVPDFRIEVGVIVGASIYNPHNIYINSETNLV